MTITTSFRTLFKTRLRKSALGLLSLSTGLGAIGLLSGCSSVEPRFYSLAPISGSIPTQFSMPSKGSIEVHTASVPLRLDRDRIVQGRERYRLKLADAASWSEPLGDMLTQTLVSDIAQRLPNRVIFAQNQFVALEPTDFVDLAVQNFEQDENGYAVINGVISVEQKRSPQNSATSLPFHWVSPQPVSADPQALVAALSEGVGVIADQAVNLLQQ